MSEDTIRTVAVAILSFLGGSAGLGYYLNRRFHLRSERRKTIMPLVDSLRRALEHVPKEILTDNFHVSDIDPFAKLLRDFNLKSEYELLPDHIKTLIVDAQRAMEELLRTTGQFRTMLDGFCRNNPHIYDAGPHKDISAMRILFMEQKDLPADTVIVNFSNQSKSGATCATMDPNQVRMLWSAVRDALPIKEYLRAKKDAEYYVLELDRTLQRVQLNKDG